MNNIRYIQGPIVAALLATASALCAQVAVKVAPAGDGKVLVTVTNTSDQEVSFLRYNTPLDGMEANLFRVTQDGKKVNYTGKLALRLAPTEQDWVTLTGHESISSEVDLAENYELTRSGNYAVQFSYPVGVRTVATRAAGAFEAEEVESDVVDVQVDEVRSFVPEPETRTARAMTFSGCTTTQKNSINSAYTVSKNMTARAYNAVGNNTNYKTWFGAYTQNNANTVKNNLNRMYSTHNGSWKSTCTTCESGVIAYVYPNRPYNVWVCAFFHQFGSTEKGSFLLHESSHWQAGGNTDDYGYGTSFCKNLAKSSPSKAIWNADSYRYFAQASY